KLQQVRGRRTRVPVVRKDHTGADHHSVGNGNGAADIYECIDLDAVSDDHAWRNVCLLAYDALRSKARGLPNVDVVPDRSTGADLNIFFHDCSGADSGRRGIVVKVAAKGSPSSD